MRREPQPRLAETVAMVVTGTTRALMATRRMERLVVMVVTVVTVARTAMLVLVVLVVVARRAVTVLIL